MQYGVIIILEKNSSRNNCWVARFGTVQARTEPKIMTKSIMRGIKIIQLIFLGLSLISRLTHGSEPATAEEFLELGDASLGNNDPANAINYYEKGISSIEEKDTLSISMSLHINLGTSYSTLGEEKKAMKMYREAILLHSKKIDDITEEGSKVAANQLAAQAAFFLGMTFQEVRLNKVINPINVTGIKFCLSFCACLLVSCIHNNNKMPSYFCILK